MTKGQQMKPSTLIYDDKGTMLVNEQIMKSYNSGSINKKGLHGDLFDQKEIDDDGKMMVNEQIMNAYSSGSINKWGLHGDLYGANKTNK